MRKRKSILWQLFFSHWILVGLSVFALLWVALGVFQSFHYTQSAENLEIRSRLLAKPLSEMIRQNQHDEIEKMVDVLGKESETRITIVLPDGEVIGDSHEVAAALESHDDRPEIIAAKKNGIGTAHRYSYTLKQHMMYTALALYNSDGELDGYVRTALPLTGLRQALLGMNKKILLGVLFIILITTTMSYWISQQMIKPLVDIKKGAEKFAAGNLDHKLYTTGPEEVWSLAETLNAMSMQLKQRIEIIKRQQQEQAAVLAGMTDGVLAVELDETIIYMNGAAEGLFDVDPTWQRGKKLPEIIRNTELQEFVVRTLASPINTRAELTFYKNGEKMMQVTGASIKGEQDVVKGAIVVLNDITQIHKLENIRREFVSNVSHELKTPITLIQGFVETLMDDQELEKSETENFLRKIKNNSERLNAIIEDLLELSRIEQMGFAAIGKQQVHLFNVVDQAAQACVSVHRVKPDFIQNNVSPEIIVNLNVQLFEQAVINLLENAIKYGGNEKPIQVSVEQKNDKCILTVKDYGKGIAQEHLERLFERFYRVDKSRSRHAGGTGLGLAIVKHIIHAHQGEIKVESTLGVGSSFKLVFPH